MNRKLSKLLFESFDRELNVEEKKRLDKALEDPLIRLEKKRIEKMRGVIAEAKTSTFKPFFAERVMRKVQKLNMPELSPEIFFRDLLSVFKKVAIAGLFICAILVSANFIAKDSSTIIQDVQRAEVTIDEAIIPSFTMTVEDIL